MAATNQRMKHNTNTTRPSKRHRRLSKLQQIRDCSRLAVCHLSEKLSPLTPHLQLLNEMCSNFTSERGCDVFELLETKENKSTSNGIGEIGVSYLELKPEKPPEHYIVLDRSVSRQHSGNLAKHGSRKTYLFYRNVNEKEKPITAISLINLNHGEEPPLGFELISQTPGANDANLTFKQKGNSRIHLCVYRGCGPPLTQLGVVHIGKKEQLPVGWHFISRTPNGKSPELDSGNTILAYKRNIHPIIDRFKRYTQTNDECQQLLAKCIACLVCGIYSFDRQTFLHALEAFTILEPIEHFPSGMLADFICLVRDSITAYISYFPREIYSKVLKWAYHVYDTRCTSRQLDSRCFINLLHLCMFLRYDDVREEASINIVNKLIIEWGKHKDTIKCSKQSVVSVSPLLSPLKANHSKAKINATEAMRSIVCGLVKYVEIVKITEDDITKFLNVRVVDEEFNEWVAEWMDKIYDNERDSYYDELMSVTMIMFAKICSQELPLKLTAKSETIKRRIHGMKLLSVFLSKASEHLINDSSTIALVLLRRVIFTSFIYNAITPIPALFKKMLAIFKILWSSYRNCLKFEIGVLLDIGIIGLLQSKYCTSPQKIDLLRGLLEIFQNRGALINIFYNYDNDINHWPICSKLVTTLSKLTENGINDNFEDNSVIQHSIMLLSRFMQLICRYLKAPHLSSGGNIDEQENFDSLGGGLQAMLDHIHYNKKALPVPSSNALLSLYSGISGRSGLSSSNHQFENNLSVENSKKDNDVSSVSSFGSNNVMGLPTVREASKSSLNRLPSKHNDADLEEKKYANGEEDDMGELKEFDVPNQPSIFLDDAQQQRIRHMTMGSDSVPLISDGVNLMAAADQLQGMKFGRRNSSVLRHSQHQEENMIIAKALKKARTEKLKTAIKFLVSHQHNDLYKKFSTLEYIAEFLYTHETLDLVEIGDFISALETKMVFDEEEHAKLLQLYVEQLNFTGQSFDTAFRHFLTDSGFRLPKEAQKIERLLVAFSCVFIKHNPHYFCGSNDSALFLAYGMLMLNTELHDPRLFDNGHTAMTKQQFNNLVQSGDHKKKLDKKLLCRIYDSVKENAIQMEIQMYDTDIDEHTASNTLYKQNQFRKECISLVNKSLAKLRVFAFRKHVWHKARQKEIVKTLFSVTWMKFLASITTILQQTNNSVNEQDVPWTQSICLDAIKYSCAAAICLHLASPQLHAFLCDLARFVFIEENKHLLVSQCKLQIIRGEHLSQEWFINIMNYAKTFNIKTACQVVSHICNDMKCKVLYDANQKLLRKIEQELQMCIYLVHPDRKFIFSGPLTKQRKKGDLDLYKFYLFNDLLIYVSDGGVVHRVLHLSLCKILDLRDGFLRNMKNAFRIVSPQKNILLIAETGKEKHEWFQLIENAIKKQIESRERWINENYQTLQEYHETARVSKYLGRNSAPKKHELNRVQNGKAIKNSRELNPDVLYEIKVFFERSNPCKLCAKPFKRFTRKSKCPWCLDIICKDCVRKKTQLPDKKTMLISELIKVCDACYGAISYFVSDVADINMHPNQANDLSSIRR